MPRLEDLPRPLRGKVHAAWIAEDGAKRVSRAKKEAPCVAIPRGESPLERKFALLWGAVAPDLELVREYRFAVDIGRRWRADFAFVRDGVKLLIELDGLGNGRHQRTAGFIADSEKQLEAVLLGFVCVRLTAPQINAATLARIRDWIRARI